MKLGSLFDGIGGFTLVAERLGIEPIWASEIESACISITKRHFPSMKHLGDITKINGAEIEPVDIITFGSPCQDLSLAGPRTGLKGERSGLFLEAVRIIKEMRDKTNGTYPAYTVLENVNGAFSSNDGEDFRTVLEEIAKIADPSISIPRSSGGGSGSLLGPLWETVGRWPGALWMPNTGEFPSGVRESSLSQILEEDVPEKYFLSQKACLGVLRRSKQSKKKLPDTLKTALEQQSLMTKAGAE